jgi:predicted molibdopterin-dependent oxidoreductase YjgC
MFRLLADAPEQVVVELDGVEVSVPAGVSVAAALLYLGRIPTRHSPVTGGARAPFCMMGACFECLVEIDGVSNQRACQRQVEAGMRLRRQLRAGGDGR